MSAARAMKRRNNKDVRKDIRKEALIEKKKELAIMQMRAERGKAEKLLEIAAPAYQADIRENVIRQMFAMSFMALHDVFGFGKIKIMRWYKKMLSLNHEALASGSKTPLDDLIVALKDEYNFDLNSEMEKINNELDAECKEKAAV
jgi:hypothetical protein